MQMEDSSYSELLQNLFRNLACLPTAGLALPGNARGEEDLAFAAANTTYEPPESRYVSLLIPARAGLAIKNAVTTARLLHQLPRDALGISRHGKGVRPKSPQKRDLLICRDAQR